VAGPNTGEMYALLIGINRYLPNKLPDGLYYKSLRGCVQDVELVERFLLDRLKLPSEHLIKLTSSNDGDATEPPEPRERWPTYENIVRSFKRLTEIARAGDQVYVHYSGHGGRARTLTQHLALKAPVGLDEVLVPADIGHSEAQYLRDIEMAHLLKTMTDKGLLVTLVLDSCHAGGATRNHELPEWAEAHGASVRGVDTVDLTPRGARSLVASDEELAATWRGLSQGATRSLGAASGWLLEPEGYVLLAACRANEYANEYPFDGQQKNGALTYWLLDALRQAGPGTTYKQLHNHILAKVHSHFAEQTPQLQGEGDREVFGSRQIMTPHAAAVMQVGAGGREISLNAGLSQGVHEGAKFAVYPPAETDFTQVRRRLALAQVTEAGPVSSRAGVVKTYGTAPVEQGCQAVLLSPGTIRLQRPVRLSLGASSSRDARLAAALESVGRHLRQSESGFVRPAEDDEPPDYVVSVTTGGEFVICDAGANELPNIRPALRVDDGEAPARVVARLAHLAKYRNVRELDSGDAGSPLARKVSVELLKLQAGYAPGHAPEPRAFDEPGHTYRLSDGEWAMLRVRNNSSKVLNVTILDLQPDWGVSQVYPSRAASFESVDHGGEINLPLRANLPPGYEQGSDILKVFFTVETTSFRWLELPALDEPPAPIDNLRGVPGGSLESLLAACSSEQHAVRKMEPATYTDAEWVAQQVEVQIFRP
jgi:hypothetical protein